MPGLVLEGVTKRFGQVRAVDEVDLAIPSGRFVCFLGPSGCGKTTLLRIIAGLENANAGRLLVDGRDVSRVPVHARRFGMVFQSLALFPHLTVAENIAYPLALRHVRKVDRRRRALELLELVRLEGMADRHVGQLSGGQRQRVAVARALAQEPVLLLMDEPMSALDAKLREAMQIELRQLQERLKITTILVTHDQREAMTMADTVVVMSNGRVEQAGAPLEVYEQPRTRFVADFIGLNNLLPAQVSGPAGVAFAGREIAVAPPRGEATGATVTLAVRPENVRLAPLDDAGLPPGTLLGRITFVRDVGASVETHVACEGATIVSIMSPHECFAARAGDPVSVRLPAEHCRVLAA